MTESFSIAKDFTHYDILEHNNDIIVAYSST